MKHDNTADLAEFTLSYIETALWSSDGDNGAPLDYNYIEENLAPATREQVDKDCADFIEKNAAMLADWPAEQAGHDFWLTRHHHGVGFWDRPSLPFGDELTKAAQTYRELAPCVGDDGLIHFE